MMVTAMERRVAEAMETIADAVESISESTKAIRETQKQLNDNFLLHQGKSEADHAKLCEVMESQKAEVRGIREDFKTTVYPIFKWMAIALIGLAGGVEFLKLVGVL